ncbi:MULTISPECIES: hypothetical protein [Siminovitchia]|uniref:LPXTG cell wall anchor domain-containing protein n=1 Tax=Siminovitchia sediminis TaxID=1274353 RepID=A0ABW4KLL3_9BACI|nr:hypothetical protein [Siminovitchia fortis]
MFKKVLGSIAVIAISLGLILPHNDVKANGVGNCSITIDANRHVVGNEADATGACKGYVVGYVTPSGKAMVVGAVSKPVSNGEVVRYSSVNGEFDLSVTVIPKKSEPAPAPQPKPAQPKPQPTPKPAEPKPTPQPKPAPKPTPAPKPVESKPVESKPKPTQPKSQPKPVEAKPTQPKPQQSKPTQPAQQHKQGVEKSTNTNQKKSNDNDSRGSNGSPASPNKNSTNSISAQKTNNSTNSTDKKVKDSHKDDKQSSKNLSVAELKDKNAVISKEGNKHFAIFEDEDGKEVKQEISKLEAEKLHDESLKKDDKDAPASVSSNDDNIEKNISNKATSPFIILAIGLGLLIVGGGIFLYYKKKK